MAGYDQRRVHGWFGLMRDDNELAATCEVLSLNIDTNTRRVADMAEEVLTTVRQLHKVHLDLPAIPGLGEGIELER